MKKYKCNVCDWIYDEAKGDEVSGLKAGTKWTDIPEDWVCPDCGMGKSDFKMTEI
jgi:rubredoxin